MTCVSGLGQVRRRGQSSHDTLVFLNRVCLQGLHVRFIVFTSASLSSRLHSLSRRSALSLLTFSCRWSPSRTLQFSFTLYQVHYPHNEPSNHSCRCFRFVVCIFLYGFFSFSFWAIVALARHSCRNKRSHSDPALVLCCCGGFRGALRADLEGNHRDPALQQHLEDIQDATRLPVPGQVRRPMLGVVLCGHVGCVPLHMTRRFTASMGGFVLSCDSPQLFPPPCTCIVPVLLPW